MGLKKILFIGPSLDKTDDTRHPGGQLTAAMHFLKFCREHEINVTILNTYSITFNKRSTSTIKIGRFIKNIFWILNNSQERLGKACLVFSGSGLGFYEKIVYAWLLKLRGLHVLFFIRGGTWFDYSKKSKVEGHIRSMLLKIPTWIGAQGKNSAKYYLSLGIPPDRVRIIHNWCDILEMADSETRPHHRRVRFVYVGWLIKEKGVLDLFEVIKSHSEFSEYEFYFIGGGTLQTTLENEVEKAGFNHVKILGWKSPADVKTILEDMDVLVLPSYSEGFPNVILEAMCARLPIIASDVGSISDAVVDNENGFLFTPGDHERLAQVIKILGEDQALRRKFSEKSWEIVNRNHDLKKNIPQILRVLENFQQGI